MKDEINLPLALQDFMPTLLFAVGLFFIAKMIANRNAAARNLAYFGGFLITLGGVLKATWKLVQAVGGSDIPVLNYSLFVLLSAGFICLAWAFWKSRKSKNSVNEIWTVPLILIVIIWTIAAYIGFLTDSRAWFFLLLGATTLANVVLLFGLIFRSFQNKLWFVVALFLVNLIVVFALARMTDLSVTMQWIKQFINTIAQAAFAVASWLLLQKESKKLS